MGRLLAFDPGVHHVGWAAFDAGRLTRCGLVAVEPAGLDRAFGGLASAGVRVLIEKPQIYSQDKWEGDPNDLVDVAIVVGMIRQACAGGDVRTFWPHAWKGSAKKKPVQGWIAKRLDEVEIGALAAGTRGTGRLAHNVWDAVGIGLHGLGRLRSSAPVANDSGSHKVGT